MTPRQIKGRLTKVRMHQCHLPRLQFLVGRWQTQCPPSRALCTKRQTQRPPSRALCTKAYTSQRCTWAMHMTSHVRGYHTRRVKLSVLLETPTPKTSPPPVPLCWSCRSQSRMPQSLGVQARPLVVIASQLFHATKTMMGTSNSLCATTLLSPLPPGSRAGPTTSRVPQRGMSRYSALLRQVQPCLVRWL